MARPRIAIALGSGAARGWSHIGILEALHNAGIEPDIVCGSSIGALVGAAYVTNRLAMLKSFAEAVTWSEIVGLLDVRLTGGGLISGQRIVALLHKLNISAKIEDCDKPYAAIATDLEAGREVWLREGPIAAAVRASISLPGIFSPAQNGDRWLVDGGLVNPVPVSVCRALGADVVIAVNLNSDILEPFEVRPTRPIIRGVPPEFTRQLLDQIPSRMRDQISAIAPRLLQQAPRSPGYFDVLTNSINIMQDYITRSRLAGEPPHVMLTPRLRHIGLMEFHRAAEAFAEGHACVKQAMPALQGFI
jgi:NTE family protein